MEKSSSINKNILPDLRVLVKEMLRQKGRSMGEASRHLGMAVNYLSQRLKGRDPKISVLLNLSAATGTNLLNRYTEYLPEKLRATPNEEALRQENEALRAELDKVKEENARLWGVIEKRG